MLRFANVFSDIIVAGKIVNAGARFVQIPEDVCRDGIEPHRLGHAEAFAPIGSRNAWIFHLTSDNPEGLAVEGKLTVLHGEGVCHILAFAIPGQRKRQNCEAQENQCLEKTAVVHNGRPSVSVRVHPEFHSGLHALTA